VTGAASGLGAATATMLFARSARVLITDLDSRAAEALARKLDPSGERAIGVGVDVTRFDEVAGAVALAVDRFGRLDLAVNNAGIGQAGRSIVKMEEEEWRRVVDVNLTAVFFCLKHEIAAMLASGGGAIVNMASALGNIGSMGASAYVASKHGVVGLTKATALEVAARNIRINAVAPGVIDTPLVHGTLKPGQKEQIIAFHPIGRLGVAQEVAELVCFLLSTRAAFITGSTHLVDGGWTAH
jgi:NAD(P)-dependent dehydrogenase (short-subunit alcohol dehydrogenase family)